MTLTAITDVSVFDGRERREHMTVVFDKQVNSVGRASEVSVPVHAQVCAGAGRTVLPGLIDMHVHVYEPEEERLAAYLAHGVTTVKDVGNELEAILQWRRSAAAGEIPSPRIFACGPLIDGPEPMWPEWSIPVATAQGGRDAVDRLAEAGVDGLKLYVYLEQAPMRAVIERAHEHGLSVTAHLGATRASDAIALGLDGIEHAAQGYYDDVVPEELRLDASERTTLGIGPFWARFMRGWARVDPYGDKTRRFAELVASRGVVLCPTLVVLEETLLAEDDDVTHLTETWTEEDFSVAQEGFERVLAVVGVLHASGARVVAGSDIAAGASLHRELELLVRAGLSPEQALATATRIAARALGRVGELGVIAEGAVADLVLVEGDPLEDINAVTRTTAVFASGEPIRSAR